MIPTMISLCQMGLKYLQRLTIAQFTTTLDRNVSIDEIHFLYVFIYVVGNMDNFLMLTQFKSAKSHVKGMAIVFLFRKSGDLVVVVMVVMVVVLVVLVVLVIWE